MKKLRFFLQLLIALLLTFISIPSHATTFTDKTAFFLGALGGGWFGVLNFDSLVGDENLSGTTQTIPGLPHNTGIIFPNSVTDPFNTALDLMVVADNPTTTPNNSLGTNDPGNYNTIIGGTNITLGLTNSINGFGLSFITPDQMFDDDIRLVAGGNTASLEADVRRLVGNYGGADYYSYFLGVIENTGFTSASIQYGPNVSGGPFLFNIDDIYLTKNAPEPESLMLLLFGVTALLFWRGRRRWA